MVISYSTFGNIDTFRIENGTAQLLAWVTHPTDPFTSVTIFINGRIWKQDLDLIDRPDIQAIFSDKPHVRKCGVAWSGPIGDLASDIHETTIKMIPNHNGKTVDYYENRVLDPVYEMTRYPLPPTLMQEHVGGSGNFLQVSFESTRLLKRYIEKYGTFNGNRILDWGCGCGRTARTLLYYVDPKYLYGCDIDRDAIEWVRPIIKALSFEVNTPYPPLPYPDNFFGIIYGMSIMTHLDEDAQQQWLAELYRVSAPGAIVILSVLTDAQRRQLMGPELGQTFHLKGEASFPTHEAHFERFAPREYYRIAFQSPAYIERAWSRHFEVLEFVVAQMHQDLVIMRLK